MTDDERKKKVDILVEITAHFQPRHLSIRIEWTTFERFQQEYALSKEKDDPYFWLFYGMIGFAMSQINYHEANPTPIDFIFDNQNKIGERAKRYYQTFKGMCTPRVLSAMGKEPQFGDEKVDHPLQAADMFAWYRRRNAIDTIQGEWHERIWKVLDKFHTPSIIEENNLHEFAYLFGVMKRP